MSSEEINIQYILPKNFLLYIYIRHGYPVICIYFSNMSTLHNYQQASFGGGYINTHSSASYQLINMATRTVTAKIIYVLSIIHILPSCRSRIWDGLWVALWTFLSVGFIGCYIIVMDGLSYLDGTLPNVFSIASSLLVPSSDLIFSIPALTYLCYKNPIILQDHALPTPKGLPMLMVSITLYFLNIAVNAFLPLLAVIEDENPLTNGEEAQQIFDSIFNTISFLGISLVYFIISCHLSQFCKHVDSLLSESDDEKYCVITIRVALEAFSCLKLGLSPLLFMIYTGKCINLINVAFVLIKSIESVTTIAVIMMSDCWDLVYLTWITHDTHSKLKQFGVKLR